MEVTFMEPHDYNCCCDTKKKEKKNCFGLIATILAVALGVVIGIIEELKWLELY